jgi:hypothetical protein
MGLMEDSETQAVAVETLANIIDRAEGVEAAAVGQCIRDFGVMAPLLELLNGPATRQDALRVLGNLASNAVDPHAESTKQLLHELGAFPRIVQLLYIADTAVVVYALGAVQNLLVRPEYAEHMRST